MSTSYSSPKPLPDIPASPVLRRLTLDSNALLSTFIQRIVHEEGLDTSWTDTIKSTLAEFGEYVESSQILPGLKAARKAQNNAWARTEAATRERHRKDRERTKDAKAGKNKGKGDDKDKLKEIEKETIEFDTATVSTDVKFKEIHALTSTQLPAPTASPKHLFLTVVPFSDIPPDPDTDFDIIPAAKACLFTAESYSFPFYTDEHGAHGEGGTVICGLDSWQPNVHDPSPRIVGGTFSFHNLTSSSAFESLTALLKLSTYTYLSLILEQHVLANSQITLQYPSPPPLSSPTSPSFPVPPGPSPLSKRRSRSTKSSSGIWSFLSRKTEGIIHRVAGANVDGASVFPPRSSWRIPTPRTSEEGTRPVFNAPETESASNTVKASHARVAEDEDRRDRDRFGPFTSVVRRIQDQHCVLSTSPRVIFPLPPLVARLARREEELRQGQAIGGQRDASSSSGSSLESSTSSVSTAIAIPGIGTGASGPPSLRLTGVEKTGLGSVLGWEGREARGRGMAGIRSFVRHQGLTVLYAEHVPVEKEEREMRPCGRPRWVTYRYWGRARAADAERDRTVGELVEQECGVGKGGGDEQEEQKCEADGCGELRGRHCVSWTCGGVKVGAGVREGVDEPGESEKVEEDIMMWQTCAVCGRESEKMRMDDGTYLFSFAKYLELLIWSPFLSSLSLCDHVSAPSPLSHPQAPLSASASGSRFHILRHFAYKRRILTLTLTSVHSAIYEVRLPQLQVISGAVPREEKHLSEARRRREGEEERRALGMEVEEWWRGIRDSLDGLEEFLEKEAGQALEGKDLPPLPASDDEDSEDDTVPSRSHSPSPKRPQASRTISFPLATAFTLASTPKPAAPYPPGLPLSIRQSRKLLRHLRASFQSTEDSLRKQIVDTPAGALNDVRRAFRATARGTFKRLAAWQEKHAPGATTGAGAVWEPEWWSGTCHAVPGGRVVVREGEWGSVIAFTLSSLDYQRELASLNANAGVSSSPALSTTTLSELQSASPNATIKATKSPPRIPDPDDNDTTSWEEAEAWSAVITRRDHPREVSSLLSLRDVLRTKRSFDSSSLGSRFTGSVSRGAAAVASFTPPSAWAQPQVQVNLEAADGQVSQFPEAAEEVERVLEARYPMHHHAETTLGSSYNLTESGEATPTPSNFVERHIRTGGTSTIVSFDSKAGEIHQHSMQVVAPKPEAVLVSPMPVPGLPAESSTPPSSSSFSGALSSAMRYFLNTGPPSRAPSPAPSGAHHGLLGLEAASQIDERPHIKYDWTIGKRLKFSCTVYYAKQFDVLRKRCGVDNIVIKSLERSENWTAVGGKSKSNFWKSSDDRFIIKTLVNAWNVADLQVLIELAPSYFRYVDSTASKASVLAKLMGFYTIEVKNLETGSVQAKHDLLVMENLFYNQKVAKTFDLKGIQSRRVKHTSEGTERRTLFDGEWIEAQQRTPLLIQPHSGHILQEAIRADADFLAKSNIMDYSLLLGIDEERREISCGLVDTIGSYTFAKTLEYKAKQNLNSGKGKEVTVVPPGEYHNRFVNSMDSYFNTCPDKWTKPPHFVDRTRAHDLTSVV